jgi:benzoyl-CoA reductase/2-hydroxyglutaryl-CoA dehydratase subunit BcrC/BadD/HgdB
MSVFRRHLNQARDSLRQASDIVALHNGEDIDLQQLKDAARQAAQASEVLNRLVGMKMAEPKK